MSLDTAGLYHYAHWYVGEQEQQAREGDWILSLPQDLLMVEGVGQTLVHHEGNIPGELAEEPMHQAVCSYCFNVVTSDVERYTKCQIGYHILDGSGTDIRTTSI